MPDGNAFDGATRNLDVLQYTEQIIRDSRQRMTSAQQTLSSASRRLLAAEARRVTVAARLAARQPKTVAVLHQDVDLRELLVRLLGQEGYVASANSCHAGRVTTIRQEKPDLVILDVDEALHPGWYVARRLRADPTTRHIPLLLLTLDPASLDRKPDSLGARCEMLLGPLDILGFLETVTRLLATSTGQAEQRG